MAFLLLSELQAKSNYLIRDKLPITETIMENNQLIKIGQASHITSVPAKRDKIHCKMHPKRDKQAICTVKTKENNHLMWEASHSMEHNHPIEQKISTKKGDDTIK